MKLLAIIMCLALIASCQDSPVVEVPIEYPNRIGDIAIDPSLDDPDFTVCDEDYIQQHYAPYLSGLSMLYEGDKPAITAVLRANFPEKVSKKESGYITTRFVVNCEGKTDRFRVEQMSLDYKKKKFKKSILSAIDKSIRSLDNWKKMEVEGRVYDYYVYISVRIENGVITNVLP